MALKRVARQVDPKEISKLLRKLLRQEKIYFPPKGSRLDATKSQGVYIIFDRNGLVAHVGRTHRAKKGINQRLNNHLQGKSSFVKIHLNGKGARLRQGFCYQFLVVENHVQRALLEALALGRLCPLHIGVGLAKNA